MSEGQMYGRGLNGQTPNGMSVRLPDKTRVDYGTVPLNGEPGEHVTQYGDGWHRSWDNPGPTGDHYTDQATGKITDIR